MNSIEELVAQEPYRSNSWKLYTEGLSIAFLDIETTGLSHTRDSLILGGLLLDSSLYQYLASSPPEEKQLLQCYIEKLSKADLWISYNGDSFDVPFLTQRLRKNSMTQRLPLHQSVDLYRLFRRYWPMAKLLPDLKQTTLEASLGLAPLRKGTLSGKESAVLYEKYVSTGDPELRAAILLHNHEDLRMLPRLLPVLNKLDLHHILFENGFLVCCGHKKILIQKNSFRNNVLHIEGRTEGLSTDVDAFFDTYHWSHNAATHSFSLSIPYDWEKNACYVDLEALEMDFTPLCVYPAFVSGYLLLRNGPELFHREINHMIKIILTEILKKF